MEHLPDVASQYIDFSLSKPKQHVNKTEFTKKNPLLHI
jgi:hypothetical protein